jgi:nitroimidazol reductase NimA-like FMN-containing flavoprotein (pyridoxamine 5'-phosphate oxidase superfamily)
MVHPSRIVMRMADQARTDRTRLRRKPARGSHDFATIAAICDEALVCHIAFTSPHGPVVIPTTFVRTGEQLYVHGSAASRMLETLAEGGAACIAITLLDALVLAKTALHHSANYRSVVAFGCGREVTDKAEKHAALAALLDKIEPGRSRACRPPNDKELAATMVIAFPLAEASAKTRTGGPLPDDPEDTHLPYWAGTIPIVTTRGSRIAA